jgi:hypothetical protein
MRTLAIDEIEYVNGALLMGPVSWMMDWAGGEALDWLVRGGFQGIMTSYGQAVQNGQGLPGSSGVAV